MYFCICEMTTPALSALFATKSRRGRNSSFRSHVRSVHNSPAGSPMDAPAPPTQPQPPQMHNRFTSMGRTLDGRINDHGGAHVAMSYASSLSMSAGQAAILEITYARSD